MSDPNESREPRRWEVTEKSGAGASAREDARKEATGNVHHGGMGADQSPLDLVSPEDWSMCLSDFSLMYKNTRNCLLLELNLGQCQ